MPEAYSEPSQKSKMELFAKIVCLGSRCARSQRTSVITPLLRLVPGLVWRKENILRKLIRVTIIFVVGLPTLFDLRSQRRRMHLELVDLVTVRIRK